MATNDQVMDKLTELEAGICQRLKVVETLIGEHERRLINIEAVLPFRLENIEKALSEFKAEWGKWMKYLFLVVLLLILILAATIGVTKLAELPVLP